MFPACTALLLRTQRCVFVSRYAFAVASVALSAHWSTRIYGFTWLFRLTKSSRMTPMIALPMTASGMKPAASTMPAAIDQNRNARSSGSLMAVRNRTMDSAPTMPSDSTTFDVTARMTSVVIIVSASSATPKPLEYITP